MDTPTRRTFLRRGGALTSALAVSTTAGDAARGENAPGGTAQQMASPGAGPRNSGRRVKIGIVGGRFGLQFQWHLHPDCEVTAVCDLREDRLQALSKVYRTGNMYKDFREFLGHPELDAVGIFTPATLHGWMAAEAMEAGKHVISAVPAALTIRELEQLIETVKRTGMKYMMAETTYYRPQIITCRQWAKEDRFGQIFYSESEYHHEGIIRLGFDERGLPTWRHGFPPMFYPTHQTSAIIPVTGERLAEVQAIGWGDGHEVLRTNQYQNPFWNTTGFFKTTGGHACRIAVFWHVPAGSAQRTQFYGERLSYIMGRHPENHPNVVMRFGKEGETVLDSSGYPEGKVAAEPYDDPPEKHWHLMPEPMRVPSGHAGSHPHICHEFISAIVEDRHPEIDVWESVAYTIPGLVAHQSALKGGEMMKIKDYGKAPV